MMHKLTALAIGVVAGIGARALGAVASEASTRDTVLRDTGRITNTMVNAGREVFDGVGNCFACHGQDLEGTPAAPSLRDHNWNDANEGTLPEIYRVITHGVERTAMVAHVSGNTDTQAGYAAVYI